MRAFVVSSEELPKIVRITDVVTLKPEKKIEYEKLTALALIGLLGLGFVVSERR